MADLVLYAVESGVATLTLNRPEQRNALSLELLAQLQEALRTAAADSAVSVLVLTGSGDKAFCSGADLRQLLEGDAAAATRAVADIFLRCAELEKPLIGAVNGHALAGGFGLALSCHLLVASTRATFGAPEIKIGLWPMMISAIVTRHLPQKRAMELFMTGRRLDAQTALEWGLVNAVVEPDQVLPLARRWAEELAQSSAVTVARGLTALRNSAGDPFPQAVSSLRQEFEKLTQTSEFHDAVRRFLDKS